VNPAELHANSYESLLVRLQTENAPSHGPVVQIVADLPLKK